MQEYPTTDASHYSLQDLQRLWDGCQSAKISQTDETIGLQFRNEKLAKEIKDLLYAILPIREEEYPNIENATLSLRDQQYYFLHLYIIQKSGTMSEDMLGDQYFLKTLRDDDKDFSTAFISGIIPGPKGPRYQNLRPREQGLFTFSAQGRVISRVDKKARHPEKKKGYSQIQSCSLVDKDVWTSPFGFSKARELKLYGLMTHRKDALVRCYLIKDSGTVGRPFDFPSKSEADQSTWCKNDNSTETIYYPAQQFEEFKGHNYSLRNRTEGINEVLARLRFNPHRSIVAICAKTLDARLLAYKFAEDLLEEFRRHAVQFKLNLNPNYRIPIIIYTPKTSKRNQSLLPLPIDTSLDEWIKINWVDTKIEDESLEFQFYTSEMRQKDITEANRLHSDKNRRLNRFYETETVHGPESNCNYDLLLGLSELSDEHFNACGPFSLVRDMFEDGYIKRAIRLLGPFQEGDPRNRCYRAINALFHYEHFDMRTAISRLILSEEFEIAEYLLKKIRINKFELRIKHEHLLVDILIKRGNPRHFAFMGLEEMLIRAVVAEEWIPIKLCIKEFPLETKPLLGLLLFRACEQQRPVEVNFLLARDADKTYTFEDKTPIVCSAVLQDWTTVAIFTRYHTDEQDNAHYGFAVLEALKNRHRGLAKSLLLAGAKTTWRQGKKGCEIDSALFFALLDDADDADELLKLLYPHEYSSKPIDTSLSSQERWEALLLRALANPNQHNLSYLHKLHGLLHPTQTESFRCLHFIFKDGYNQTLDNTIIAFIDEIIQRDNYQVNYQSVLLNLWIYHPYYSDALINALLNRLKPTYIRHLTLLCLKDILNYTILNSTEPMLLLSLGKMTHSKLIPKPIGRYVKKLDDNFQDNYKTNNPHEKIMEILDNYTRNNINPSAKEIALTLDSVLDHFNKIIDRAGKPEFFRGYTQDAFFSKKMFEYLTCVKNMTDPQLNLQLTSRYTPPDEFDMK